MSEDIPLRSTGPVVVAVIQARMGSTRLPGKVLMPIDGVPLLSWTVSGVRAIRGVSSVVVATTTDPDDDAVATLAVDLGVSIHRGSSHDVLARCADAVTPFQPDVVIRQTADNPFPDPAVAEDQVRVLLDGDLDYVGIDGWPLGIAAEACRYSALAVANREATDRADREHVMTYLYRQRERFRIGRSPRRLGAGRAAGPTARYTVDTEADLAFARALAARLPDGPPVHLSELESIIEDSPELIQINSGVAQHSWRSDIAGDEGRDDVRSDATLTSMAHGAEPTEAGSGLRKEECRH
jgi:spore coat polysaccharide biosynthesis protein SpsF